MIAYASATGTKRNLDAMRAAGWRLMLTPLNRTPAGMRYCIDNGAFSCWTTGKPFDAAGFRSLVSAAGRGAEFIVVPDVVTDAPATLAQFGPWYSELEPTGSRLLLALQDGMTRADVVPLLDQHPAAGLFLGGSTEWKLRTMIEWGGLAAEMGRYYHVARVNSARRIMHAQAAGADSFDGTSVTRYAVTLPMLDACRRQSALNFEQPATCADRQV